MMKRTRIVLLILFLCSTVDGVLFALEGDKDSANKEKKSYSYNSFYWNYPTPNDKGISLMDTGHRWVKNDFMFDFAMLQMG